MANTGLVTGAGGFIGHHLVKYLVDQGYWVRGVDIKHPEYEPSPSHEFELLDLRRFDNCLIATRGIDEVYHLAADMGGIGYITAFHADIARNSAMINIHMLEAARINAASDSFSPPRPAFTRCICRRARTSPTLRKTTPTRQSPRRGTAPRSSLWKSSANTTTRTTASRPGWSLPQRLRALGHLRRGQGEGPGGHQPQGGSGPEGDEIEVWGDGEQTRSFMHVEDCVEGIYRIMRSDYPHPLNLGTDELVTINELVDMVAEISGKRIAERHDLSKPQGVGPKQRQQQAASGAGVGARDPAEGRAGAYLPLDRVRAQDRRKGP